MCDMCTMFCTPVVGKIAKGQILWQEVLGLAGNLNEAFRSCSGIDKEIIPFKHNTDPIRLHSLLAKYKAYARQST